MDVGSHSSIMQDISLPFHYLETEDLNLLANTDYVSYEKLHSKYTKINK